MTFSHRSETSGNDDAEEGQNQAVDEDGDEPEWQSRGVRDTGLESDLDGILHDDCIVPMPNLTGIMPWLKDVYTNSRGFELGTFDSSLLPVIWKKQSVNWDHLALGYVSDIVFIVHNFISTLISAICDDQRVQSALMSVLMDGLIDCYKKSIDHTKFIISVEKDGTPQTLNHYFAENLEKS